MTQNITNPKVKNNMEIKIDINELRKRKLFVAAPMYGGQCAGMFCRSTNDLAAAAVHYGIELRFYYLFNESLITRARNYCMDEFMRSDCTHMIFIDSDIGFNAQDIITFLALMSEDSEYDILCGPYPKKCISWEKVKAAVDMGIADEDANVLEKFVGDYVFNPVGGVTEIPLGEPVEVLESGTGFMMIKKSAVLKFAETYPEYSYRPDHVRTAAFDGSREILQFFQAEIDPESKRYLSEDYWFCQKARKAGIKVWLAPWVQLQHVGSYIFGGSLADLASVGAAATVDPSKLGKKR
jgi:hypothetical protein